MATMSDLPENLVGEILCRVPMTSLQTVRSVCKQWNTLSKNWILGNAEQFLGFMMMDSRVCSLRFDLQGIRNDGEHLVEPSIKQIIMFNQIEVSEIIHCDGLVLCVVKDRTRLLVWNPYLGQTRWIQPRNNFLRLERYALGFDKNRNHKILRFVDDDYLFTVQKHFFGYEIYDFSFDSWRVLDVTPDWDIDFYQRGVSLNGNTYFFARQKLAKEGPDDIDTTENPSFLLCFDFTAEKFGPRLTLPFHYIYDETVTLSCVKEEQLSVLYQHMQPYEIMEIWVSTKIEPNAVSWSKFLKVDMRPLTGFQFDVEAGSFFIDQEKKVAVVFDLSKYERTETCVYQMAYIIGQDGYFKSVNIGEAPNLGEPGKIGYTCPIYCLPLVCSSYVPSLVQID